MTTIDELREADWRRREAMISGDAKTLNRLLAEELIWTHSSGRQDDKRSFLEKIAARTADYRLLEVTDDHVSQYGAIMIHRGNLSGRVVVDGREKTLSNRFLGVWRWSGERFELLAWQSTGF